MSLAVKLHIQRHKLLLLAAQRLRQQRVKRLPKDHAVVRRDDRHTGAVVDRPPCLRTHGIHVGKILSGRGYRLGIHTYRVGELLQQTHDLTPLGILQLLEFVRQLHNLHRLDVDRTARGRLVMYESAQLAFVCRRDGNHRTSVTHREHRVGIHDTRTLGIGQHLLQAFCHLSLVVADGSTYRQQFGRGAVAYAALVVDYLVYTAYDVGKDTHIGAARTQTRILRLGAVQYETDHIAHGRKRPSQDNHLRDVEEAARDTDLGDDMLDIGILLARSVGIEHQQHAHLVCRTLAAFDLLARGTERLLHNAAPRRLHTAQRGNLRTKTVKTDLLLKICGIYHRM